jgi:hypothetical protein
LEKSKAELRKKQVEFSKLTREKEALVRKMEEHEITLEKAVKEARTAKDASSAANLRARKAQIIGSRHSTPRPPVSASSTPVKVSTPDISVTSRAAATKATNAAVDLGRIRKEVMELLEKYDKEKLDRIDIIMEKFKGKEELLVDKMKQRYESGAAAAGGIANLNLQRRSEMALQRHKDRMQKKLEQQQQQKEALGN